MGIVQVCVLKRRSCARYTRDMICIDEIQDIHTDSVPVIEECVPLQV